MYQTEKYHENKKIKLAVQAVWSEPVSGSGPFPVEPRKTGNSRKYSPRIALACTPGSISANGHESDGAARR